MLPMDAPAHPQEEADKLCKLIRIKVQDDNDLKAAHGALTSCHAFFANLRQVARRRGVPEINILQTELRGGK